MAYYLRRTSHGSSLSRVVHSWVMARSDRKRALELFREGLKVDMTDTQSGTTPEGIHLGAMAGTVDLIQRGHTGIETRGDTLYFNPRLPAELKKLSLCIYYRGHSLDISITRERLKVSSRPGKAPPIKLGLKGKTQRLKTGNIIESKL
jgi:alpha,alpha-trehalase